VNRKGDGCRAEIGGALTFKFLHAMSTNPRKRKTAKVTQDQPAGGELTEKNGHRRDHHTEKKKVTKKLLKTLARKSRPQEVGGGAMSLLTSR